MARGKSNRSQSKPHPITRPLLLGKTERSKTRLYSSVSSGSPFAHKKTQKAQADNIATGISPALGVDSNMVNQTEACKEKEIASQGPQDSLPHGPSKEAPRRPSQNWRRSRKGSTQSRREGEPRPQTAATRHLSRPISIPRGKIR